MNLLNRQSKKELNKCLQIQLENNKILRENLRKEQAYSRNLEMAGKHLKEELEKVKHNLRIAIKDNEELAKIINEMVVKYDIKLETGKEIKPKPRKPRKKKVEVK